MNHLRHNNWSTYVQNPAFLEASRIMILNPDAPPYEIQKLGITPGCRVLDVGCGTGFFCRYLGGASSGVFYTGIDLDETLIAYADNGPAADARGNTYQFLCGDAAQLPFADGFFDVVVSHTFLTAAFCYEAAFQEMKRVCRPGGIIGTVNIADFDKILQRNHPVPGRYQELFQRFMQACEALQPLSGMNAGIDPQRIPEFFTTEGMEDVTVYPIGSFFSLSNGQSALPPEKAQACIRFFRDAMLERLSVYKSLRGFSQYLSDDECEELRDQIMLHAEQQMKDSTAWDYDAMLYLLVVGRVPRKAGGNETVDSYQEYRATKYKDNLPKNTIHNIQAILDKLGIATSIQYTQPGTEHLYSCRIRIKGTDVGQNGKGTTPDYAIASGYAEFMERLSTGYMLPFRAPDLEALPAKEAASAGGDLLRRSFSELYQLPEFLIENETFLEKWSDAKDPDGCFPGYRFTSWENGASFFLPEFLYRGFAFTNGSCAGNSREEALVQGLCEIIERYAALQILKEKMSPPPVPEAVLKRIPELYSTLQSVSQETGMRLFILDASLGKGLPVVAALLVDPEAKKAIVHFGAHPHFEVALERSITELMQGRYLKQRSGMSPFGEEYEETASSPNNLFNILKAGQGVVSQALLEGIAGNPSWEYTPFRRFSKDNFSVLGELKELCRNLGWDIFHRDCSFFGFPVYHVFIPQASMILNFGKISIAQNLKKYSCIPALKDFAHSTAEERQQAVKTLGLFRGWILHDTLDSVTEVRSNACVLGLPINANLLTMLNALNEADYSAAAEYLKPYSKVNEAFWCLYQLCLLRGNGSSRQLNPALLKTDASFRQALDILDNPFAVLPCCKERDCQNCPCSEGCDTAFLSRISSDLSIHAALKTPDASAF